MQRHLDYTRSEDLDSFALPAARLHEPIAERSEPVSPDGSGRPHPLPSDFSVVNESLSSSSSRRARRSTRASSRDISIPDVVVTDEQDMAPSETTFLLPRARLSSQRERRYDTVSHVERQEPPRHGIWNRIGHQYPSFKRIERAAHVLTHPKAWDPRAVATAVVVRPLSMIPSVFLGVLLNLLDALSYGIILFPLGEEIFSSMGADGVSMFYVSCIVSQLVYSSGSIFRGGVGSEMVSSTSYARLFPTDTSV